MKAIINGLRYDTDNAIEIGNYSYGYSSDFSHWEATLYKTPKAGRFFLAGSGGPMSRYGKALDNNSRGGSSRIDPLTEEEAMAWAEEYLDADVIEEFFHDKIEEA